MRLMLSRRTTAPRPPRLHRPARRHDCRLFGHGPGGRARRRRRGAPSGPSSRPATSSSRPRRDRGRLGAPTEYVRALPEDWQAAYQVSALARPDVIGWMPCNCGCGADGHRSNLDCFFATARAGRSPSRSTAPTATSASRHRTWRRSSSTRASRWPRSGPRSTRPSAVAATAPTPPSRPPERPPPTVGPRPRTGQPRAAVPREGVRAGLARCGHPPEGPAIAVRDAQRPPGRSTAGRSRRSSWRSSPSS